MNIESISRKIAGNVIPQEESGGIVNKNFHLVPMELGGKETFLTLYPDRKDWWKVKKNVRVTSLFSKVGIPTSQTLSYGLIVDNGEKVAYLLKEFIDGKTFDSLMSQPDTLGEDDWRRLSGQLGYALSAMHAIKLENFGMIKGRNIAISSLGKSVNGKNWLEFVDQLMMEREDRLVKIFPEMKIGDVSGVDIYGLFNKAKQFYLRNRNSLSSVNMPYLTHNDMYFSNVMAKKDQNSNRWNLRAIVDMEWALGGDPDLDLVQLENWLQFSPYRDRFLHYKQSFLEAYQANRQIPNNFPNKRMVYHILRSLSYLTSVFDEDYKQFAHSPKHVKNVRDHFDLTERVMSNGKINEIF